MAKKAKREQTTEVFPYPSGRVMRAVYRFPLFLYRLGLGPLIGRLFMVLTTTGRKSGLPRHTALEFHRHKGRKFVVAAWAKADWYRNIQANPLVTVQTAWGTESARARRLTTVEDLSEAWAVAERNPLIRAMMKLTGVEPTRESFLAQKDRIIILTFDPTDEPTPSPLRTYIRAARQRR